MTIREQIEDASLLVNHGRYKAALTTLLLAVSASSRRTFPKGTKSRENPKSEMSDREAFTLFLGSRVKKILFGDFGGPDEGNSTLSVIFRDVQHDVAYILYKFYRCELVHDGDLPEDVEFIPPKQSGRGLNIESHGVQLAISCGTTMVLDYGWLNLLQKAVVNARCNGAEFGIDHFDIVPRPGVDETTFLDSLTKKYGTSPGRIQILRNVVRQLSPDWILGALDDAVIDAFSKLVESKQVVTGAITGLKRHDFTDHHGVLQQRGINLLREISSGYHYVAVS